MELCAFIQPLLLHHRCRPSNFARERGTCCRASAASQYTAQDAGHINRCIDLASNALGQTRPNPPVGCVITTPQGDVLGEGFHLHAGLPHAEVNALLDAERKGNSVVGATAYVSLEPCNHYGRTPPCSKALLKAGVQRVVVGMQDPDPRTAGNGIQTLRDGGLDVCVGVQEAECLELAEGFVSRILKKRPIGVLKYAMTLDGKIATGTGSSKWVTGVQARSRVQRIRRECDAIVVGGETVRKDNPSLTVREGALQQGLRPIRVVMTRTMQLPAQANLWSDEAETVILADASHGNQKLVQELVARGVAVEQVPGLNPDDAMAFLHEKGCLSVLWECGGGLAASAIKSKSVQKVHAFVAPKIIGGAGPGPVGLPGIGDNMQEALVLRNRQIETFDNGDLLVTGYLGEDV